MKQLVIHRFGLGGAAFANGFGSTVAEMIAHEGAADGAQGFLDGGDLHEDVGAVAVFGDHASEAAGLAFDAAQALEIGGLDLRIDAEGFAFAGFAGARRGGGTLVSGLR